jgi:hypothetical protein
MVAAVLVALALVLPMSKCTSHDNSHTVKYHYIIADALDDRPNPNLTHDELVRLNIEDFLLSVAAFFWPLIATLLARRQEGRLRALIRLISEPILIAGSLWWLQIVVLFRSPAIGYYVVTGGLILYSVVWVIGCVHYWNNRGLSSR